MLSVYGTGDLVWIPDATAGRINNPREYQVFITKMVKGPVFGVVTKLDYNKDLVFVSFVGKKGIQELGFRPAEIRKQNEV